MKYFYWWVKKKRGEGAVNYLKIIKSEGVPNNFLMSFLNATSGLITIWCEEKSVRTSLFGRYTRPTKVSISHASKITWSRVPTLTKLTVGIAVLK